MLTSHVGHYPRIGDRPEQQGLRRALHRFDRGEIKPKQLKAAMDQVTREAIAEQVEAGLDVVTDGMIRWEDPLSRVARGLSGMEIRGMLRFFDTNTFYRQPVVVGGLERKAPITIEDFRFAASCSKKPVKVVLPGPYTLAALSQDEFYHDRKALVMDLAWILNAEARDLIEAGAQWIQFDEPAILRNKQDWPLFEAAGVTVLDGLDGANTMLQTYFGDLAGIYPEILALPYDYIGVDFTEYGAVNFELLEEYPFTKGLAMGLIDARNTRMESVEGTVRVIGGLAALLPHEMTMLTPNCGLEFLPRDYAQNKLQRLVEIARCFEEVAR